MNIDYPISNITINCVGENIGRPNLVCINHLGFQVNETEFFLEVQQVAKYLVRNGNEVFIQPHPLSDNASVQLFLAGSAFGAVLHQQHMLPLHGSSFRYHGKGIVVCGVSGSGKSSVVASFNQHDGHFINDDITPLKISDNQTTIVPIKTKLKLWEDSLEKLNLSDPDLVRIRPSLEKFYLPVKDSFIGEQVLNQIFILTTHNKDEFCSNELSGFEKYNAIKNQVYRKAYLKGMPETQKVYFKQLLKLSGQIVVKMITRPEKCSIADTREFIRKEING